MIESLLLTAARVCTFEQQRLLTNASSFFFERDERLFLVTTRHVMIDEPSDHFPDRIEIELHIDPDNMAKSTGFSIPLYRNGKSLWRQGLDTAGEIDVAVIEIERAASFLAAASSKCLAIFRSVPDPFTAAARSGSTAPDIRSRTPRPNSSSMSGMATAEKAAAKTDTLVPAHTRRKPVRKPFPDHLPRERVIVPGPTTCACCGSTRLSKLGEDITETLEVIPRQWKVIEHVREKFTCPGVREDQPSAGGPSLLAMILYAKFALHQPLNRQSEAYAREAWICRCPRSPTMSAPAPQSWRRSPI